MICCSETAPSDVLIAWWLDEIPCIFGERARYDAFVALARAGIPEPLLPSALNIVDSALDGLPALQTRAVWELAAAAPTAATVCALLRHALRYSQLAWKPYELG